MTTEYNDMKQKCSIFSQLDCLKHNYIINVQDTVTESGRYLIREFISHWKDTEIHLFSYDCDINLLIEETRVCQEHLTLHDCLPKFTSNFNDEDELQKFVSSLNNRSYRLSKLSVIIDSLSTLFLQKQFPTVIKLLRQISSASIYTNSGEKIQIQIVTILHEDTLLNPKRILAHMKILSHAWIRVYNCQIDVAVRKKSARKSIISVFNFEGRVNDPVKWHKEHTSDKSSSRISNDAPSSTFKLTLSESERKARDAVVLPYERFGDSVQSNYQATIIYEPDEYDDWDEEDPDNDLEFS